MQPNKPLAFVVSVFAAGLIILALAFYLRFQKPEPAVKNEAHKSELVLKSKLEATNLICFKFVGKHSFRPYSPLVIIGANAQATPKTVRLADLWDELWPATYVSLKAGDLQETITQIKPIVQDSDSDTNEAGGDVEVIIVDPRWTAINTIGRKDMCQLLQRIPPHVLQDNKLFNDKINEIKLIEGCMQTDPSTHTNFPDTNGVKTAQPGRQGLIRQHQWINL